MSSTYVASKMGLRSKPTIDERYTRPQGLYGTGDVDLRKLRKLILSGKLAPCFPGQEGGTQTVTTGVGGSVDVPGASALEPGPRFEVKLDECPICFLNYPVLNHSRCCKSVICTECFLQVKAPAADCSVQCPFCKSPGYTVEFRGKKTEEQRALEEEEEAAVSQAQRRAALEECRRAEERAARRLERLHASSRAPRSDGSPNAHASDSDGTPTALAEASARGEGSGATPVTPPRAAEAAVVPEGWEDEYAASTPPPRQPRRPSGGARTPSPLPPVTAGGIRHAAVGGGRGPTSLSSPLAERERRRRYHHDARAITVSASGVGAGTSPPTPTSASLPSRRHVPRHLLHQHYHRREAEGASAAFDHGEESEGYDDGDENPESRDPAGGQTSQEAGRGRATGWEPPDVMDPAFLRRIQDFVPAHLLDHPVPEAMMSAGNLDIDDIMIMEALWLSLQHQDDDEEQRRQGREAAAAEEAAEVAAAIAQVEAAEIAERRLLELSGGAETPSGVMAGPEDASANEAAVVSGVETVPVSPFDTAPRADELALNGESYSLGSSESWGGQPPGGESSAPGQGDAAVGTSLADQNVPCVEEVPSTSAPTADINDGDSDGEPERDRITPVESRVLEEEAAAATSSLSMTSLSEEDVHEEERRNLELERERELAEDEDKAERLARAASSDDSSVPLVYQPISPTVSPAPGGSRLGSRSARAAVLEAVAAETEAAAVQMSARAAALGAEAASLEKSEESMQDLLHALATSRGGAQDHAQPSVDSTTSAPPISTFVSEELILMAEGKEQGDETEDEAAQAIVAGEVELALQATPRAVALSVLSDNPFPAPDVDEKSGGMATLQGARGAEVQA